jgi:hypothetical protein
MPYSMAIELMNYQELVNSFIFSNSLIKYPDGRPRTTDIDFVACKFGFFIIGECKTFSLDQIRISLQKFTVLSEFYNQLPRCEVYFVGTDSNTRINDDDIVWVTSMERIQQGQTKTTGSRHVLIHRDQMTPRPRKELNWYLNRMLDLRADPFIDPKEVALKINADGR